MSKQITNYKFGEVKIDETTYTSDLAVCSNGFIAPWKREKGHDLRIEDLTYYLYLEPSVLIVGTGMYGVMKVSKKVKYQLFESMPDTTFSFLKTGEAIYSYNYWCENYKGQKKLVLGAFHLYC